MGMNKKNLFIVSVIANVALIVLIFVVKKDAAAQAQKTVTERCIPMQNAAKQANDFVLNNNVLWSLIDSTWKSPDKSIAFVKKLAEAQKVPRCGGKDCTGSEDEAKLKVDVSSKPTDRSITVGWISKKNTQPKYFFKVIYKDVKGKNEPVFETIDAYDLMGKSPSQEEADE